MAAEGNGQVSYSVKELIGRLEGKIDSVLALLQTKADRMELEKLSNRVQEIEDARHREAGQHDQRKEDTRANRFWWSVMVPSFAAILSGSVTAYIIFQIFKLG